MKALCLAALLGSSTEAHRLAFVTADSLDSACQGPDQMGGMEAFEGN